MPSTAGSAAGVGMGALINSAGSSASSVMGIGMGRAAATGAGAPGSSGSGADASAAGTLIAQSTAGTSAASSGTITWDNNGTLRSINPGDWSIEQCLGRQPRFIIILNVYKQLL